MPQIIDGTMISKQIKEELKAEVAKMQAKGKTPCLAVIQVGEDPASSVYVKNKQKACAYIGIESKSYTLCEKSSQEELLTLIEQLNQDSSVHGILVQLPLPSHMQEARIIEAISPKKDVDCFHPQNVGALWTGTAHFLPCTPAGIIELLKRTGVALEGANCVIIGRSNIVGKPMAALLLQENATVTMVHSKTKHLSQMTRQADVLIVAMGRKTYIKAEDVKEGAVVIDVGIHRLENGTLCGDVDFEEVFPKAAAITPVPGGVGPMTIAMLMKNCIRAVDSWEESK
jgi:methylenetetrahydrofolate dehydrogenase (NADP+)/methenyltetrahydrofolate cyclohydrolase